MDMEIHAKKGNRSFVNNFDINTF